MAILEGDIKLLKSAVMNDTSEGGGQMTGTAIVDGQSNNLFPDTSEIDRALGRVNLRKVFGVAHSGDSDTLLGSHAMITDAPDDPLVHCALMKTTNWSDTRNVAKELIERYLVKGPRYTSRIMDAHYAGSLQVRLYAPSGNTDFPAAGDAVVLRTPGGVEQYVRVTKTVSMTQNYTVYEGASAVTFAATVVTCDLGQALTSDFAGPPVARVVSNEATTYATIYVTQAAEGTQFYGIKTLGEDAFVGDVNATTTGGIFTPLVPAATIETPIIEQSPYAGRTGVCATSQSAVTLTETGSVGPNVVFTLPTAVELGSFSLVRSGSTFTDLTGQIMQGTSAVGTIDYATGIVTFSASCPSYGSASNVLTYKPASKSVVSAFSSDLVITLANRGLSFTNVFAPTPAPFSFSISYMAQGRWYVLTDNGAGKLEGADSTYGVGTINYATGSAAFTLGAIPDVGSSLIADWGDSSSAIKITTGMATKFSARLNVPDGSRSDGVSLAWSNGVNNYTATTNASGTLSGDATGQLVGTTLTFAPNVFPDGNVTGTCNYGGTQSTSVGGGYLAWTLNNTPSLPGTFRGFLVLGSVGAILNDPSPAVYDGGNGVLYSVIRSGHNYDFGADRLAVGTINYETGVVAIVSSVTVPLVVETNQAYSDNWGYAATRVVRSFSSVSVSILAVTGITYSYGTPGVNAVSFSPTTWYADTGGSVVDGILTSDILFKLGDQVYSAKNAGVSKALSFVTGVAATPSAGSVDANGVVAITSLPNNGVNTITWYNIATNAAGQRTSRGVFRTATAPLKAGVFQLLIDSVSASGSDGGVLSGAFTGSIDYTRGIVRWTRDATKAGDIRYNAVFLQYLPLDGTLLGLETARLPLDGKVPIFRSGCIVVVHNTQTYALPNPLVKPTVYNVGRVRVAAVKVKTAAGITVDTALYTTDLDAGTLFFPAESDLTGLTQPFSVEHRIEDVMLCSIADISGTLTFTRALTHDYPADTSYVSSALVSGDVFARSYNFIEQSTWTGVWSDALIGSAPTANFNETLNPIAVTNIGAITEQWAIIFTNTTTFRVVGKSVGEIGAGNISTDCAPLNPATSQPYFTIPAAGWGSAWTTGNVYRFNTAACGTPFWVVRTVLQGPATLQDDKFTVAFRGDVDRP